MHMSGFTRMIKEYISYHTRTISLRNQGENQVHRDLCIKSDLYSAGIQNKCFARYG